MTTSLSIARAWRKAIRPLTTANVNSVARKLEPKLKRRFLAAVKTMQGNVDLEALAESLRVQASAEALAAVHPETWPSTLAPAAQLVPQAFQQAGQAAAGQLSSQLGADISFTLTNPRAVQWGRTNSARLISEVGESVQASVRELIGRAFTEGIPPRELARLIRDVVGLTERQAQAVVNYRKELLDAGRDADDIERLTARYGRELVNWRALTIARTECLPGDTLVDAAVVGTAYRRWYSGDLIEIRTRRGRKFTATPNHPMFTHRGWVGAGAVYEGEYLVCDARNQRARASGDPHVTAPEATIAEVFDTVSAVGVFERRRGTKPDFHGDGMEVEVDVASAFWPLAIGAFAPLTEQVVQRILSPSDLACAPYCSCCGRLLPVNQGVGLCVCSRCDASLFQAASHNALGNAKALSDTDCRFTREITRCNGFSGDVVSVIARTASLRVGQSRGLGVGSCFQASAVNGVNDGGWINSESGGNISRTETGLVQVDDGGSFDSISPCGAFGERSSWDAGARQPLPHARGVCAADVCHLNEGQTGHVELDRVLSVVRREWSGHVYNLSTPDGYFTINGGIYTGNTIASSTHGQQELWRQAVDKGLLDPEKTKREWLISASACAKICLPMEDQQVGLEEWFTTGDGGQVLVPPAHTNCVCGVGLSFTD